MQFEPVTSSLLGYIRDLISNALLYHEARIRVLNIEITEADSLDLLEGKIEISIDYEIRGTNSRYNYVYDYYRTEGIN
jgi:phage baseplate assembly protein W